MIVHRILILILLFFGMHDCYRIKIRQEKKDSLIIHGLGCKKITKHVDPID